MFSILIPTWNNLPFLKLCVESIRKNSTFKHQILLHINEGSDGTLDWAKRNQIQFTHSSTNIGICKAVNLASELANQDYIVFMNDDMYVLPQWDKILAEEIQKLNTDCFMFSSTMIEPYVTNNSCVIVADYGKTAENFREEQLLNNFSSLKKEDWSGSTWPPSVVHKKWWDAVVGYSEEFSPGMSSDDDFAMKMWKAGCRIYKGVSASRVYHFVSKSTGRVIKNDGRKQFLRKWGMKQSTFHQFYIKRGIPYSGELESPKRTLDFLVKLISDKISFRFSAG
jgi:glycosyltransferase involved in cell wall biosynthesis